jgi:hypothetical protein
MAIIKAAEIALRRMKRVDDGIGFLGYRVWLRNPSQMREASLIRTDFAESFPAS